MELDIKLEKYKANAFILFLKGTLDSNTCLELKNIFPMVQESGAHVLINMAGIKYVSISGFSTLFELRRRIQGMDGFFGLFDIPEIVQRALTIIRAEELVTESAAKRSAAHPFREYLHAWESSAKEEENRLKQKELVA